MKKLLLLSILVMSMNIGRAQYYTFYQDTVSYSNLVSPTIISTPGWDYMNVYAVPIPFNFQFYGMTFDTFYVAGGFGGFVYDPINFYGDYQIAFYDAPLIDRGIGLSTISYVVIGTAPARTLKLQIDNAGFEDDQIELDYVNVQLWFYEGSNIVEIHNGPNSVVNNDSWYQTGCYGPGIYLAKDTNTFVQLHGSSSHPALSTTYVSDCVTDAPPETIVYGFEPNNSSVGEINNTFINVFPNPSNGEFNLDIHEINSPSIISIYNTTGQLVFNKKIQPSENIKVSTNLDPGIYLLKVSTNKSQYLKSLVISR